MHSYTNVKDDTVKFTLSYIITYIWSGFSSSSLKLYDVIYLMSCRTSFYTSSQFDFNLWCLKPLCTDCPYLKKYNKCILHEHNVPPFLSLSSTHKETKTIHLFIVEAVWLFCLRRPTTRWQRWAKHPAAPQTLWYLWREHSGCVCHF